MCSGDHLPSVREIILAAKGEATGKDKASAAVWKRAIELLEKDERARCKGDPPQDPVLVEHEDLLIFLLL